MAKVDKKHFDTDQAYTQGLSDGVEMVKSIFEMTTDERQERFGYPLVAEVLDHFDFIQIRERMERLSRMYIIRGIKVDDNGFKHVVVESDRLSIKPDEVLINAFLNCHREKHITFACVEEIYVKE
jgi:hypothetical protein